MNKVILLIFLLVLGTSGYFLFSQKPDSFSNIVRDISTSIPEGVNINASFDIYTNGTRRIFTDSKYHNQSFDVFIEAISSNTVHVKKQGITWDDFFKTLPMSLTKQCLITGTKQTFCTGESGALKFYINGVEDKDALDRVIGGGGQPRC